MDLIDSVFTSGIFVDALAGLLALLLLAATSLIARHLAKVGVEIEAKQLKAIEAKVAEGILAARTRYRSDPDSAVRNDKMHSAVVSHVLETGGKAAKKLARSQLDAMIHAGVRRLKSLL